MVVIKPILFAIQQWQLNILATESNLVTIWRGQVKSTRANEFMWHLMKTFLFVFFFLPIISFSFICSLVFLLFYFASILASFVPKSPPPPFFPSFWYVPTFYFFFFHRPFHFFYYSSIISPHPPILFFSTFFFTFALCFFPFFFCSHPLIFLLFSSYSFFSPSA